SAPPRSRPAWPPSQSGSTRESRAPTRGSSSCGSSGRRRPGSLAGPGWRESARSPETLLQNTVLKGGPRTSARRDGRRREPGGVDDDEHEIRLEAAALLLDSAADELD